MFHAGTDREQEGSRIIGPYEREFWSIVYGVDLRDHRDLRHAPIPQVRHRDGRRPYTSTGETDQPIRGGL